MNTNIYKNFILNNAGGFSSSKPANTSDIELVTTRKAKPDFDINRELTNRTFIRPLPPKGHIVKNNIFSAPLNFVQDVKTDFSALKAAAKGEANDHQLGKLNDLGMKLGGLAIASYLFTIKHTPIKKAMEFVGLGSFFASMAIWPKIALDIPARLIHGFSPFMRYEDSQGRKKGFFSDNQYIPFDMLSDKDITRIGNRLRVPKDQPNRREAIEGKMRQIALQNNTMWMLTAGFATPIMSSLICNVLEPYVDDIHSFIMNKKIDNVFENFSTYSSRYRTKDIINSVNRVLNIHNNSPINEEILDEITNALASKLDNNVKIGIKEDLKDLMPDNKFRISERQLCAINTAIDSSIKKASENKLLPQTLKTITPTEKQLKDLFTEKGWFNTPLDRIEVSEIIGEIKKIVSSNINTLNENDSTSIKESLHRRILSELGKSSKNSAERTLGNELTRNSASLLNESVQKIIRAFAADMTDFCAEHSALHEYSYNKLAFAPDTAKAKYWNDTVKSIIKLLNITPEEIETTRYDRKLTGQLINRKIWQIAQSDENKYKDYIKQMSELVAKIDKNVKPSDLNNLLIKQIDQSCLTASANFINDGFKHTAEKVYGKEIQKDIFLETGTVRGAAKAFVKSNLHNVKSTFAALINKTNVYRTLFKNPDLKFLGDDAANLPKSVKEEFAALIEYLTTEGRISDYFVKFDFIRNLNPDTTDKGALKFDKDGIKYDYYTRQNLEKSGGIIKTDTKFFKMVMNTLFNIPIEQETASALVDSTSADILKGYRKDMYSVVGNIYNFMYPASVTEHPIDSAMTKGTATPSYRSNSVGAALDETFANTMRQLYNTRKWVKIFGGFGAGLLGFTVLSQFLFGRNSDGKKNTNKA